VSTTKAIIADFFCFITQQRHTNNLYYLSFRKSVIAWPQELILVELLVQLLGMPCKLHYHSNVAIT
jgi:hypothetical protein